jgi:hypothetical protein
LGLRSPGFSSRFVPWASSARADVQAPAGLALPATDLSDLLLVRAEDRLADA